MVIDRAIDVIPSQICYRMYW